MLQGDPTAPHVGIGEALIVAIVDEYSAKAWFRPSQTWNFGRIMLYPKIFKKIFFFQKSILCIPKLTSTARIWISIPLGDSTGVYLSTAILGFWLPYKPHRRL